jgi:CBS domain-containing protein
VGDLKIGSPPKTISYTQDALSAFALMEREQISGTAIIDDKGHLYGSISTWDLKHAAKNTGTFLWEIPC